MTLPWSFGVSIPRLVTVSVTVGQKPRSVAPRPRLLLLTQAMLNQALNQAEGTGLEPQTGFPARHFQCRRLAIRLPSEPGRSRANLLES